MVFDKYFVNFDCQSHWKRNVPSIVTCDLAYNSTSVRPCFYFCTFFKIKWWRSSIEIDFFFNSPPEENYTFFGWDVLSCGGGRRGEQDKQLVKSHQKRLRANLKLVSQNMEQEKSIKTSARYSIRQILTTLGLIMFSVRYLDSILYIFCYAAVTL